MNKLKSVFYFGLVCSYLAITGCSPEIGSKAWCEDMDEKDKGDWTVNEASEYTKNCIFRRNE